MLIPAFRQYSIGIQVPNVCQDIFPHHYTPTTGLNAVIVVAGIRGPNLNYVSSSGWWWGFNGVGNLTPLCRVFVSQPVDGSFVGLWTTQKLQARFSQEMVERCSMGQARNHSILDWLWLTGRLDQSRKPRQIHLPLEIFSYLRDHFTFYTNKRNKKDDQVVRFLVLDLQA